MNNKLYCINPNTKEYEEVKSICGISIEEILDLIRDYKISKDLKFDKFGRLEEIERLGNELQVQIEDNTRLNEYIEEQDKKIERLHSIIKEVREYIKEKYDYILGDDTFLDHDERIDSKQMKHILEILDNDEVEIIEEDKKIEKIEYVVNDDEGDFTINGFVFDYEQKMQIIDKINEIIDKINEE